MEKLGYHVFIEPLLAIEPQIIDPPDLRDVKAVMLTSANAVLALQNLPDILAQISPLPCFCVGANTAATANAAGFTRVDHSHHDGIALAHFLKSQLPTGTTILHPCGNDVISGGSDLLAESGYHILSWPLYAAIPAPYLTPALRDALANNTITVAMFFSPRTAQVFGQLLTMHQLTDCCTAITGLALSKAVATMLQPLPLHQLVVATKPDTGSMLELLLAHCPL